MEKDVCYLGWESKENGHPLSGGASWVLPADVCKAEELTGP